MNKENDIKELCKVLPSLSNIVSKATKMKLVEWDPLDGKIPSVIDTFHPSGENGVVEKDDDYLFHLRANHFIVSLGYSEDTIYKHKSYFKGNSILNLHQENTSVLITANHKGHLMFELIEFDAK